jgi:N-acetylneuraminate synthase
MTEIMIGNRAVGDGHPTYVVAEAGVNHKGSLELARQMVWEAAGAGADAIKFQSYKAETLVTRWAPRYWEDDEPSGTQFAIFKRSDMFGEQEFTALYEECQRAGIAFLSTPFDLGFVHFLDKLGMPAFKIASADLTNLPLVRQAARKGKPLIMSTGASTLREIRAAVETVRTEGNEQLALLHCVLSYPTRNDHANLLRIPALARKFPDIPIGFSDHTISKRCAIVPTAAVALGAQLIEKHFTLRRTWPGDDHYLSVDPKQLTTLVRNVRTVEKALGSADLGVLDVEAEARQYARRSIVARVDISRGSVIERGMLIMKRPGTGISPMKMDSVVGCTAGQDIRADTALTWDMLVGKSDREEIPA